MTTIEILEALRAHSKSTSDYQVSKVLGIRQQLISQWRSGNVMSDTYAIRCARILGLPPAYLLACVNAERASAREDAESSDVYRQIADTFKEKVALWLACLALGFTVFSTQSAHAAGSFSSSPPYTLCEVRGAVRRRRRFHGRKISFVTASA